MKTKLKQLLALMRNPAKMRAYAKWLGGVTKPFLPSLLLMMVVDAAAVLIGFGSSFVSKSVVDHASSGQPFQTGFTWMIGLSAVSIAVGALVNVASTIINERFAFGVRCKAFDRLLGTSYLGAIRYHSGDLMTRLTSDAGTVAGSIASAIPGVAMILVRLIAAFVLLYSNAPTLALAALLLAPAGLIITLVTGRPLKKLSAEAKEREAAYRSFLQERLANLAVVKTFCLEDKSRQQLSDLRAAMLDTTLRRTRMSVTMGTGIRAAFQLGYFIAFGYCISGLFSGDLTYGTMTLFLSLFAQIQQPLTSLGRLLPQAVSVLASADRLMELEAIPADIRTGETAMPKAVGLAFRDVSFAYGDKPVLDRVSFTAAPGQLVGVMGPSGVGKTTLIRLALSLAEPTGGEIAWRYDGREEAASADARRLIAYVPQGNTLMSGTIADNLRFGDPNATEDDMWKALGDAAADFVRDLPEGLHTMIGEKASGLSEGQAQRIAIARALLRRTPVMILDEATSALDAASEESILARLTAPDRTWAPLCLIITHRKTMIPYFDRLLEIMPDGSAVMTEPEKK